jgi:ubiquinone/menaquinone biosynthesis C-methylase UbiE
MIDPLKTNARLAYAMLAERYDAMAPTKPHNALYERPASLELLGSVDGLTVLDAACGTGIATEQLARSAAKKIHAFDITPEMLALARKRCAGLDIDFREADLAKPLAWLADASVDRILCTLALDHLETLAAVFAEFHRVTRRGGRLVFSMSHPMRDWQDERTRGTKTYFETNLWGMEWAGFGKPRPFMESIRRPLGAIVNPLVEAGWVLDRLVEPLPQAEMKTVDPRHYQQLMEAPGFICIRARKE